MISRYSLALLLACAFAGGCGQKGPLYLPGDPSEIKMEVPRQDQTRTGEDDEEEEELPGNP